jgi:hypothetical protein
MIKTHLTHLKFIKNSVAQNRKVKVSMVLSDVDIKKLNTLLPTASICSVDENVVRCENTRDSGEVSLYTKPHRISLNLPTAIVGVKISNNVLLYVR